MLEELEAVKKLVWSQTLVTGGTTVELALAPLPDVAGPFQDLPRWGGHGDGARGDAPSELEPRDGASRGAAAGEPPGAYAPDPHRQDIA